ncbi:MAG: signal peptidase I [Acidobacteriota bacterium]|nr:signal peptidase I [Acidobacteriota bacterium]
MGRIRIDVQGTSMAPLLATGDWCVAEDARSRTIRCGDIILFRRDKAVVVHRVIAVRARGGGLRYLQKGDKAPEPGWIPAESVLGRVRFIEKRRGMIDTDSCLQVLLGVFMVALGRAQWLWSGIARRAGLLPNKAPTAVLLRAGRLFSALVLALTIRR